MPWILLGWDSVQYKINDDSMAIITIKLLPPTYINIIHPVRKTLCVIRLKYPVRRLTNINVGG